MQGCPREPPRRQNDCFRRTQHIHAYIHTHTYTHMQSCPRQPSRRQNNHHRRTQHVHTCIYIHTHTHRVVQDNLLADKITIIDALSTWLSISNTPQKEDSNQHASDTTSSSKTTDPDSDLGTHGSHSQGTAHVQNRPCDSDSDSQTPAHRPQAPDTTQQPQPDGKNAPKSSKNGPNSKNKTQNSIQKDEYVLPRRAGVLVTEIFGDDPLSESFLPSLLHAREHLLTEDAVVIPSALSVYAVCVESGFLRHVASIDGTSVCMCVCVCMYI
jgi:hypothetical protein